MVGFSELGLQIQHFPSYVGYYNISQVLEAFCGHVYIFGNCI